MRLAVQNPGCSSVQDGQLLLLVIGGWGGGGHGDGGGGLGGGKEVHLPVGAGHHGHHRDGRGLQDGQLEKGLRLLRRRLLLRRLRLPLWVLALRDDLHLVVRLVLLILLLLLHRLLLSGGLRVWVNLPQVLAQPVAGNEGVVAARALVPPLPRVLTLVPDQGVLVAEAHGTLVARELLL